MSGADAVADWIGTLPDWQQDLARRVAAVVELTEQELLTALAVIKSAHGVSVEGDVPDPIPLTRDDLPLAEQGPATKLTKFGFLRGVGLIVNDAQLDFAPDGLTIVFGPNAAGKSSYVRGLKAVCRTVDHGCRVRGNVYDESPEPPSANVEFSIAGKVRQQRTPLDGDDVLRLTGLSVFDSACAELYVDEKNMIQYIPSELLVLTRLAATQDSLRTTLETERSALLAAKPSLDGLAEDTTAGAAVRSLRGDARDVDLAALAALTGEDLERLDALRAAVAAADASTAKSDALAAQGDADEAERLAERISALEARTGPEAAAGLRQAAADDGTARGAVVLANEQFAAAPIPGVGSEPWTVLWSAARSFATAVGRHSRQATVISVRSVCKRSIQAQPNEWPISSDTSRARSSRRRPRRLTP